MPRKWLTADYLVAANMRRNGNTYEEIGAALDCGARAARYRLEEGPDAPEPIDLRYTVEQAREANRREAAAIRAERDTAPRFKLRPGELEKYLNG